MFILNLKINKNIFMRIFKIVILILTVSIFLISVWSVYKAAVNGTDNAENYIELDSSNYTNFLKDSHENINVYVGKKVKITGYVYRLPDFSANQFVIARTMLINSTSQAVVVGMLCECDSAKDFDDYSWVEINGVVEKGNYHGDMPILKIIEIKKVSVPEEEFVKEPLD